MLSRRVTLTILLGVLFFSLIQRLPTDFEATGKDTFINTAFARSIADTGSMGWIVHPLSHFGLFPASMPSGGPAVFASLAILSGVPIGAGTVFAGFALTVLSLLAGFLLGRTITNSDWAALLVASAFALSPRLLVFTGASGSTRAFTLAFFPVILLLLVKAQRHSGHRRGFFSLALMLVFVLAAFHRSFLLAAVAFPAFIVSLAGSSKWTDPEFRHIRAALFCLGMFGLLLIPISGGISEVASRESDYATGFLFQGDSPIIRAVNLLLDYASSLGIVAAFVPLGLWHVLTRREWLFENRFLLFSILAFVPLLGAGQYTVLVFLPLMAILGSIGLVKAIGTERRPHVMIALGLASVVVLTSVSAAFMTRHWEEGQGTAIFVDSEVTWASAYLRTADTGGFFVSNDWSLTSYKVWTISGNPPLGRNLAIPLSRGVISSEQLEIRFSPSILNWYTVTSELEDGTHWISLMRQDPKQVAPQYVVRLYELHSFLEKRDHRNAPTILIFIETIHETQYKIWETEGYSIWTVPRV